MSKTIASKELSTLTGLSDRRHRQIAEQGFFPPPTRGVYDMAASVAGIIRYYRERVKGADPLTRARLAKLASETELNQIEIDQKHRVLAPVAEVIEITGKYLVAAKARIYSDPHLALEDKDKIVGDLGGLLDAILLPKEEPEGTLTVPSK